jgi:hypothetical protein
MYSHLIETHMLWLTQVTLTSSIIDIFKCKILEPFAVLVVVESKNAISAFLKTNVVKASKLCQNKVQMRRLWL